MMRPMQMESVAEFYASACGAVALRLVRDRLGQLWPDLRGQVVLGIGHTGPYLNSWRTARCISATPASGALSPWPATGPSTCCAVKEDGLPFADLSVDRILIVHALENAENARRMLREIWRVLKDDGRLLVVAPNRVGMWALTDSTPFGQGQPYSPGQVGRLLAASLFRVERRDSALFMPPLRHRLVLRSAPLLERAGRWLAPQFGGLTLTEAVKDVYAAMPLEAVPRRRFVMQEAA